MTKAELRKNALARRAAMDEAKRARLDLAIFERLVSCEAIATARTLMTYVSFRREVDTRHLIRHCLAQGRRVCAPRVIAARREIAAMAIADFDGDLALGAYGILEPVEGRATLVDPREIDVVLVPGLLFDRRGYRIGYGAGYFDRFLKRLSPRAETIGLAYGWQVVERLPDEPWDIPVRRIATEDTVMRVATEKTEQPEKKSARAK